MRTKTEIAFLVGKKIRALRIERNLSMEELALKSGMDYSQLSRIERGKISTSVYHIYLLAKMMEVSIQKVFGEIS